MFSCKYCEVFKEHFFSRTSPVAAFEHKNQSKVFREITASKLQWQLATKMKIHHGCFPRNFTKF